MKPPKVNNEQSHSEDGFKNEAGSLTFKNIVNKDEYGSAIPEDRSFIQLADKWGSYINFQAGKVIIKSEDELTEYIGGKHFKYVQGNTQYNFYGDKHEYIQGTQTIQVGKQNAEVSKNLKKLNEILTEINNSGIKTIEQNSGKGDRIPCQNCAVEIEVDRKVLTRVIGFIIKIFNLLPNTPIRNALDKIQWLAGKVDGFLLSTITTGAINGGSCDGKVLCKDNTIASPYHAIQKGNEAVSEKFKQKQKEIEKLEQSLPSGSKIETIINDLVVHVGGDFNKSDVIALVDGAPIITELVDAEIKYGFVPGSKGSAKSAIYNPPVLRGGSESRYISQKYELKSGSGGIDIGTSGKAEINAATTIINASKGELLLNSANKVIVGGANIILDTKGNPNGDAIVLDSDRIYVSGKLSVQGDLALKGSLNLDGGISVPHISCPGERVYTGSASSAHNVHSAANWNNPIKPDATTTDVFDKLWKILRDLAAAILGLVFTPDFLKTIFEETYSTIKISMVVDNTMIATGFAWVQDMFTQMPLVAYGTCTYGGAVVAYVQPTAIPVYNYTHNHGSPGDAHGHEYTIPKMLSYGNQAATIAARQPSSSIPTPALTTGMGSEPGNLNAGSIGPCGGGGSYYGNIERVKSSKLRRNQRYGIDSYDAYEAGNPFADVKDPKYDEDGNIVPTPTFSLIDECN
jgi:hypothetical protein